MSKIDISAVKRQKSEIQEKYTPSKIVTRSCKNKEALCQLKNYPENPSKESS